MPPGHNLHYCPDPARNQSYRPNTGLLRVERLYITMAEQSINIPQVIVFLIVTVLAVRWYFNKPSGAGTRAAPNRPAVRINIAQIDQIAQMLPQASRRDIAWDLQRNGGNAAATTERVLSGRGLDAVSFISHASLRSGFHILSHCVYRLLHLLTYQPLTLLQLPLDPHPPLLNHRTRT